MASSLPISGIFGTKRAEIRKAKQQGLQYKEAGRETKEKDALPKVYSVARPVKPAESRTLEVRSGEDFARQYRRLMSGVINFNNVKHELRWQERYEKPKYKRQRLRSARHRRRFANEVGIRVAAVLRARSQGM